MFYFYLISIPICVVVMHLTTISFLERLKKDGIQITDNRGIVIKIKEILLLIFKVCCPIFNIFYVIYQLSFSKTIYQKMITKSFLDGNAVFKDKHHPKFKEV